MPNERSRSWIAFVIGALALCAGGLGAADTGQKSFVPDAVVNGEAYYPEGPQITDDGLLVAEMPRNRIVLLANGKSKVVWRADGCGPTSIKRIPGGGYWVLCHQGHYVAKLDPSFATVATFRETTSARRITWPNDASVDAAGNLYFSSSGLFSLAAPAEGRVLFIDAATGVASELAGGIRYSNGVLVQERLKRVLVSEHLNRRMLAFPLLDKGKLGSPDVFFDFRNAPPVPGAYDQSGPDGIAAFADGDVLVADYGNGRLLHLTGDGRYAAQIPLKYRFVTNMAIARDQRSIYVTMTRDNGSELLDGIVQKFRVISGKD